MILPNLCWAEFRTEVIKGSGKPILFLDRDGVVVEEVGYLHKPSDTEVIEGFSQLVKLANTNGWLVGLISNQAGIGRGYYGWPEFEAVQSKLDQYLSDRGARLDFVVACPFHENAAQEKYKVAYHSWRKPEPGMLQYVAQNFAADLSRSMFVGDHVTDVEAAITGGVRHCVHVLTGHGKTHANAALELLDNCSSGVQCASIASAEIAKLITKM